MRLATDTSVPQRLTQNNMDMNKHGQPRIENLPLAQASIANEDKQEGS